MALLRRAAAGIQQTLSRASGSSAEMLACLQSAGATATLRQAAAGGLVSLLPLRTLHCASSSPSAAAVAAQSAAAMASPWHAALLRSAPAGAASSSSSSASMLAVRSYATNGVTIKPKFTGAKLKPYSSYKGRFKMTGSGAIRYMRPGHVHKRFNKSKRQLNDLSQTQLLHEKYAKVMRRLGFVSRSF